MVYLLSLRKYFFTFLKTILFFLGGLLLYLFEILVFLKFKGDTDVLIEALKNYGFFIVYSFPFIIIIACFFYFCSIGNDIKFNIRMIPIISALNTVLLLIFFFINFDFLILPKPVQQYYRPEIRDDMINAVGDYKIFIEKKDGKSPGNGILFYKNAYFISDWRVKNNAVNVNTYQYIGDSGFYKQSSAFSIPRKEPVMEMKDTGISQFLFDNYISYLKKLKDIFYTTFLDGGAVLSALAILLLSTGFFSIVCGIACFINDKQILILTYATLMAASILMFLGLPYFLSLIALIKFGIKNGLFSVIIPSLFVGLFSALIGYGLLSLKDLMLKRTGNR